jgi:hypothetical protein
MQAPGLGCPNVQRVQVVSALSLLREWFYVARPQGLMPVCPVVHSALFVRCHELLPGFEGFLLTGWQAAGMAAGVTQQV